MGTRGSLPLRRAGGQPGAARAARSRASTPEAGSRTAERLAAARSRAATTTGPGFRSGQRRSSTSSRSTTPPSDALAEFGLTIGLVSAGMSEEAALAAVLLYRISTFYLPPLWGFFAMLWLQRRYL
jgi:hypothetical protein